MVESRADLIKGRDRREKQILALCEWIATHETFEVQLNCCIFGTDQHFCFAISGSGAKEIAMFAREKGIEQLEELNRQLERK